MGIQVLPLTEICTSDCGSRQEGSLKSASLATLKMVVLAPIPRASEPTAASAKARFRRNARAA